MTPVANSPTTSLLTSVRCRFTLRVLGWQLAGNCLLGLLFIGWLQIPDSHIWQLILSLLILIFLVAGFLHLHVITLRMVRTASLVARGWQGYVLLVAWITLWWGAAHLVQKIFNETSVMERAGYWNSRLSPHLRDTFTYQRLSNWQTDIANTLLWGVLPALLLPLIIESVARAVSTLRERSTWRVYRRWQLWLSTALVSWLCVWLTEKLVAWQPGHSVRGELVSVVFRFAAVYLVLVLAYVALLAIVAALLAREHSSGNTATQPAADSPQTVTLH